MKRFLKTKAYTDPAVSAGCLKAVLEISIIENILDRPEKAKVQLVLLPTEVVAGCQIAAAISLKPEYIAIELHAAKDRCKVA